jgi:acetyl-CoA decarbonylase/synthase complex subunit gamma
MADSEPLKNNPHSSPCCCPETVAPTQIAVGLNNIAMMKKYSWVAGFIDTVAGKIPVVKTGLSGADKFGSYKARWGIGRMSFRVVPGLYAAGSPDDKSPVFVSANYKMSFDCLRSNLKGINSWILVLDTRGINVWCAAGKGTFGTEEILRQIKVSRLPEIVSHRRLIVPQLGAPGVQAHEVKKQSGFRIRYGPIQAKDIPEFIENGRRTTPEMRKVEFPFRDRLALIPQDLISDMKYAVLVAIAFFLLSGFGPGIYSIDRLMTFGITNALIVMAVYLAGICLPPALLPFLPGRRFSLKGFWIGIAVAAGVAWYAAAHPGSFNSPLAVIAWFGMAPAMGSFIAMNFTGSSTYTSLSGVLKEMRLALPVQIGLAVIGIGLWIAGLFT